MEQQLWKFTHQVGKTTGWPFKKKKRVRFVILLGEWHEENILLKKIVKKCFVVLHKPFWEHSKEEGDLDREAKGNILTYIRNQRYLLSWTPPQWHMVVPELIERWMEPNTGWSWRKTLPEAAKTLESMREKKIFFREMCFSVLIQRLNTNTHTFVELFSPQTFENLSVCLPLYNFSDVCWPVT